MENTESLPWYVQSTITSYEKLNFFKFESLSKTLSFDFS